MEQKTKLVRDFVNSPLGKLELIAADAGLVGVFFRNHKHPRTFDAERTEAHPVLGQVRRELAEYFAGKRTQFTTPLAPPELRGGTPFQLAVWAALLTIPFGETRSYAQIAQQIGNPSAVRAVGAANGLNPISILVPCHRVVGKSGKLTGYAGGLENKEWLLGHEAPQQSRFLQSASAL